MMYRLLHFLLTRKSLCRLISYSFLLVLIYTEAALALWDMQYDFRDRYCYYFCVSALIASYALIKINLKNILISILPLFVLVTLLMCHVAFCVGNGHGFSLENLMNLADGASLIEFFKLTPWTFILIFLLIISMTVLALFFAFGIFMALRSSVNRRRNRGIMAAILVFSLFFIVYLCYPVTDILSIYRSYRQAEQFLNYNSKFYLEYGVKATPLDDRDVKAKRGKNLVLIILESTEQNYLDEHLFPDLLPNLRNFYNHSQQFNNVSIASNATTTMGALYSIFTGSFLIPEHFTSGSVYALKPRIGIRFSSLSKILHHAGYHQYFVCGHSASLNGTGSFVHEQKFDTIWFGSEESASQEKSTEVEFSLRDHRVYEKAWEYFKHAANQNKPFNLTLLTFDAHGPYGLYDPSTPAYPGKCSEVHRNLFNAMYASDVALGKFLKLLNEHPEGRNTCVVIVSDHFAHRYTTSNDLLSSKPERRLLFCIRNSAVRQTDRNVPGKTFDIGPTILAAAGVEHNYLFPLGESLYDPQVPQRLNATEMQVAVINAYTRLKSIVPQKLPVDISGLQNPYPMLNVGSVHIPVLCDAVAALPQKDKFLVIPVIDDGIIDASIVVKFNGFSDFMKNIANRKTAIFITRNSSAVAEYYRLPEKDGFVLGIKINGKSCVKFSPSFDELFISKAEIAEMMR